MPRSPHPMPDYLPLEGGVEDAPRTARASSRCPCPSPYGIAQSVESSDRGLFAQRRGGLHRMARATRAAGRCATAPPATCAVSRPSTSAFCSAASPTMATDLTQEYVRALEARGIPHLLVGSKSFHRREEVGTLRTALRAIEWPDDELSVFAVLRGSLYAVPDDTLLRFRNAHGRFHPMRELPAGSRPASSRPSATPSPCSRELHRRRNYRPLADTIHELLERTRAHAGFAFRKGGERVLANVYPPDGPGAQLRSRRRRHLLPRLRRVPGRRVRKRRHGRGPGARAGRRRRAVDDRAQGQGPGVSGGDPGRPDRQARRAARRRPLLRCGAPAVRAAPAGVRALGIAGCRRRRGQGR